MINFHAVLIDETGCEFGATIRAADYNEAWNEVREQYPESRCVQMESPEDTAAREARIYAAVCAEYDEPMDWEDEDDWDDTAGEEVVFTGRDTMSYYNE
jgi:hypothetical protein